MTREEQKATAAGRETGWNHANFIDAYGEGVVTQRDIQVPERFRDAGLETFFMAGFEEGVQRFGEGLYPDGSSIPA